MGGKKPNILSLFYFYCKWARRQWRTSSYSNSVCSDNEAWFFSPSPNTNFKIAAVNCLTIKHAILGSFKSFALNDLLSKYLHFKLSVKQLSLQKTLEFYVLECKNFFHYVAFLTKKKVVRPEPVQYVICSYKI